VTRTLRTYLLPLLLTTSALAQTQVRISSGIAATNLLDKTDPVYPPIAKTARIQGTVVLEVGIDSAGAVSDVKAVSGPPMLFVAAMNAVKQWKYRPYELNGEPTPVTTTVSVPFVLDVSDADYQKQQQVQQLFFQQDQQCREGLRTGRFADAQKACAAEIKTLEQLPNGGPPRETAYGLLGQAYFLDKKFPEALYYFQRELESAQTLHDDVSGNPMDLSRRDLQLAYAFRHMAWGLQTNDRSTEALTYYERAESQLQAAQAKINFEILKNEYAKDLQATLHNHATLLRQLGRTSEADVLDKKSDSIVIIQ
jgi:TonB family protein